MRGLIIFAIAAVALVPAQADARLLGILKDKAKASIIDARGLPIGTATVAYSKKKHLLQVEISVKGLARGEHGVHLHTVGTCEGPKFVSAGSHWNPTTKMHGMSNEGGGHMGDLPNMLVSKKGRGKLKFDIASDTFSGDNGLMDSDGAAIVIHALSDDQRTDPSGNSGDRVACGVLVGG
jgi:superoxide dismutase, Cu-Zn family